MVERDAERRSGWGELGGALAAMLVAMPSSIAFGVVVFRAISPDLAGQGALAGLIGAAALGMIAPLVGRNGGLISAPCAPAAAVLAGFAASLSAAGVAPTRTLGLVTLTMLASAAFQVAYGAVRAGRLIKYIPFQVVNGYMSGVALIIFMKQLPNLLGAPSSAGFVEAVSQPALWRWPSVAVGGVTMAGMALAPKLSARIPPAIFGLAGGGAAYFAIGQVVPGLLTLDGNDLVIGRLVSSGVSEVVWARWASLSALRPADLGLILGPALTLSALLSIDTLKTGVVLDAMTHRRHASNRELVGQGVANLVSALGGGMSGAGTMGPTLVNVTSGGGSVRGSFAEGLLALLGVLLLAPAIAWVPTGALAGILLVVSLRMFDFGSFRLLRNPDTRMDFLVIAAVVFVAESVGLIEAAVTGVMLAAYLFIRAQMRGTVVLRRQDLQEVRSKRRRPPEDRALLDERGAEALMVALQGDLFFGTTDELFTSLEADLRSRRFVLLDFRRVQSMDFTGGHLLEQMHHRLRGHGGELLFSGMPSNARARQDIQAYLNQLGLVDTNGGIRVFETRDSALEYIEDGLLERSSGPIPESPPPLEASDFAVLREMQGNGLVESCLRAVCVAAGERVFSRGDDGGVMYFVRRGRVHIQLPLEGGKVHHVATFSRGEFFGEIAFLDRGRRTANAVAATPTELFVLSRAALDEVTAHRPGASAGLFGYLATTLSERLRVADRELQDLEER